MSFWQLTEEKPITHNHNNTNPLDNVREETSHMGDAGKVPGLADPGAVTGMRVPNPEGEALKAANMVPSESCTLK